MQPPGETDKAGFHVGEHLGQVGAQAAGAILPGVAREKRDHIAIHRAGAFHDDIERRALGSAIFGMKFSRDPLSRRRGNWRGTAKASMAPSPPTRLMRRRGEPSSFRIWREKS